MIEFIKRFMRAKGSLRFKVLYALDYEHVLANKRYFACENIEAGQFVKVDGYGNARKSC